MWLISLILTIIYAIWLMSLINFAVRAAKQIVANTELTNLNLCLARGLNRSSPRR